MCGSLGRGEEPEAEVGGVAEGERAGDGGVEGDFESSGCSTAVPAVALLSFVDEIEPRDTATRKLESRQRSDGCGHRPALELKESSQIVFGRADREVVGVEFGAAVSVCLGVTGGNEGRDAAPALGGAEEWQS